MTATLTESSGAKPALPCIGSVPSSVDGHVENPFRRFFGLMKKNAPPATGPQISTTATRESRKGPLKMAKGRPRTDVRNGASGTLVAISHRLHELFNGAAATSAKLKDTSRHTYQALQRELYKLAQTDEARSIHIPQWHRHRSIRRPTVLRKDEGGVNELDACMPPDRVMDQYFSIVLVKRIAGVSLSAVYDKCWSGSDFYHQWLLNDGKINIHVGDWETGDFSYPSSNSVPDDQKYTQKRVITYSYTRDPSTLGYRLGQPRVDCTQTMYYASLHDKRSIIAIRMDLVGEVCSEDYRVHVRGVLTKASATVPRRDVSHDGQADIGDTGSTTSVKGGRPPNVSSPNQDQNLLVDFGVCCEFGIRGRTTILAKQIRGIVECATRESMVNLLSLLLETCHASETEREDALHPVDDDDDGGGETDEKESTCCSFLRC